MAALYGANATKRNSVPSDLIPYGEVGGEVKMAFDSIVPAAALALNDTIELMKLPKGARIVGGYIKYAAQGGSCAIDIGHNGGDKSLETADVDSLVDGLVISSAGVTLLSAQNAAKFGKQMDDSVVISGLVTVAGANASAQIDLCILYVLV